MSGKRQHFIPQFLQVGFASHQHGDEVYTWVFRKKKEPFNTNLKNVGVESYFYTDDSGSKADKLITEAENSYSDIIKKLRERPPGKVSNHLIPEFIAHLEVRTRHLRQNFLKATDYLITRVLDLINDEERFFKYAFKSVRNEKSMIHKDFVREFEKHGYSRKDIKKWIRNEPEKLKLLLNVLKPTFSSIADNFRKILSPESLKQMVKDSHINVLKQSIAPDIRVNFYKKLNYSVIDFEESNLVLGDSAILFKVNGTNNFKTFVDKADEIKSVLLPLKPNRLLIGNANDSDFNGSQISNKIVKNSFEYFISAEKSLKTSGLHEKIGVDAVLVTEEEIEELMDEIFNN